MPLYDRGVRKFARTFADDMMFGIAMERIARIRTPEELDTVDPKEAKALLGKLS